MDENNLCFIDGQNLYMGTKLDEISWVIDWERFRKYLFKKYKIKTTRKLVAFIKEDSLY